ncbi:hypothetical protein KXX32_000542, partial [Aspergillus fumigatus]
VPLTLLGFAQVFRDGFLKSDLHFVTRIRTKVTSLNVLFAWLWGWDGDGNNGDWPRKHWEFKAY